MEKTKPKRAHRICMWALMAAVALGLGFVLWGFVHPYGADAALPLLTGWSYHTEDAPEPVHVDVLDHYIAVEPGQVLTLRRTLAEPLAKPLAKPSALLLRLDFQWARVTLGGRELYNNHSDPPGANKGISNQLIALPEGYLGQELTVEVSSPYALYSLSPDVIWFGDMQALALHALGDAAPDMALMAVLVLGGLVLVGFALASHRLEALLFGLFCILYGLYLPGVGAAYLSVFSPIIAARLQFSMWHLFAVPMLWFLWLKCHKTRRAALALCAVYTPIAAIAVALMLAGRVAPPDTLSVMNLALIVTALSMSALCVLEWTHKNPFFRMTAPAFLVLAVASALSIFDIQGFRTPKELLRIGGLLLLAALVSADILREYRARCRRDDEERQLLLLKEHLVVAQLASAEANNQETRLLRHEIRHHLAVLTVLQSEGKVMEIGAYLRELDALEQGLEVPQYCEHPLVNAILGNADRDCARNAISFDCEALVPRDIAIEDADLGTLLLNMLENAVEGASRVHDAVRWLSIQVRVKDHYLVITCQNARGGEIEREGDRFISTKKDARFHGYGILAMKRVAEKYESKLNIHCDDASFSVKTILRLR